MVEDIEQLTAKFEVGMLGNRNELLDRNIGLADSRSAADRARCTADVTEDPLSVKMEL